jgi:hypothetical protein
LSTAAVIPALRTCAAAEPRAADDRRKEAEYPGEFLHTGGRKVGLYVAKAEIAKLYARLAWFASACGPEENA